MPEYTAIWGIEIIADNPKEAAAEALSIQRDPFSEAVAFTVTNATTKEVVNIDLLLEDPNSD